MRARPDWWKHHFDEETLSGYGAGKRAAAEVEGLLRLLRPRRGACVLDLCCGAGRHAIPLAERGYAVTGFDLQANLLAAARRGARERRVSLKLVRGDARRLKFLGRFDAVLNLFTSFGYFATEAEHLALLRGARNALKPGGSLLIDLPNREWLVRHFARTFAQRGDGPVRRAVNRQSFDPFTGRLETERTLFLRDGTRRKTILSIRLYTLHELIGLLEEAGLKFARAWGGFDGIPYGPDSFRMLVLARKA